MTAKLESFHDNFVILRERLALARLKRYDSSRLKVPVRLVKSLNIPSEVEVFLKGFSFRSRIDGNGRMYVPSYLKGLLGDEEWVWVVKGEDGRFRVVEYREDPQLRLDEFEYTPFKPLPSCSMPRYSRGVGWCGRCGVAYPIEFGYCPRCGMKLRTRPRKKSH